MGVNVSSDPSSSSLRQEASAVPLEGEVLEGHSLSLKGGGGGTPFLLTLIVEEERRRRQRGVSSVKEGGGG